MVLVGKLMEKQNVESVEAQDKRHKVDKEIFNELRDELSFNSHNFRAFHIFRRFFQFVFIIVPGILLVMTYSTYHRVKREYGLQDKREMLIYKQMKKNAQRI
mmetsp:Transcript_16397/g.18504  ORF Transcript_16397/g.18504 Transcript_16397/m.18504 type:complete len:102 (+) Transcript_16397:292-597(+)